MTFVSAESAVLFGGPALFLLFGGLGMVQAPATEPAETQIAPEQETTVAPADGGEAPVEPSAESATDGPVEGSTEPAEPVGGEEQEAKPTYSVADIADTDLLADPRVAEHVARERKSAEDRQLAKLRKEAGKEQNVRVVFESMLKSALEAMDLDYDPASLPQQKRDALARSVGLPWQAAVEVAASDFAERFPSALLRGYDVPKEAVAEALEAHAAGDWDGYATILTDAAIESKYKARAAELEAQIAKRVQDEVAAELKARGQEEARKNAPKAAPSTPGGEGGAGGLVITTMADADAAYNKGDIDHARYKEERKRFGLS